MPTFAWIGTARINTDHIVSIEPKAHGRTDLRWTVTLADGRTLESAHDLAGEGGTIIPAPPGLVLVEELPPGPSDADRTIDYDTTVVVAFRVHGNGDPTPITLCGDPPSDRLWAVIQPDGRCIGWGAVWDNLEAFKAVCEQRASQRIASAA